jgi:predicted P-loop ATPase
MQEAQAQESDFYRPPRHTASVVEFGGVPISFTEPAVRTAKPDGKQMSERMAATITKKNLHERAIETKDGTLRGCLANALNLLRFHSDWVDGLAFNEFSLYAIAKKRTPWGKPAGEIWRDHDDALMLEWLECAGCFLGSSTKASEAVEIIARENSFHPVKDYLKRLEWDKQPRLNNWLVTYAGAGNTPLNRAMGERWFISSVARVCTPGCQADSYLQLEGKQGIRKSSLLRAIAGDEYFTDHVSELGSKDSRIELHGKLIIEYPELDRLKGRDLNRVKAFLTARYDCFRPPYGRRVVNVPRSCVFAATTNDYTSLTDETGGRRCWPVRCGAINIEQLGRDRDQLWAEAYAKYARGENWYLDTKELNDAAEEQQDLRYSAGIWDEIIELFLDNPQPKMISDAQFHSTRGRVLVREILQHCIGKEQGNWNQGDINSVVRCLVHNGYEQQQSRNRNDGTRGFRFYVKEDV